MKKYLLIILAVCGLLGTTFAWDASDFSNDTAKWLYDNGLTKYATAEEFHQNDFFTREQAAKFFSQFAIKVMKKTPNTSRACSFSDIDQADSTLKADIITSCQLGIFQGSKGMFDPKRNITLPEAIAVLMRVKYGKMDEINVAGHWYDNYLKQAEQDGLKPDGRIESTTLSMRGTVGQMLYYAANPSITDNSLHYNIKNDPLLTAYLRGFPAVSSEPITYVNNQATKPMPNNTLNIFISYNEGVAFNSSSINKVENYDMPTDTFTLFNSSSLSFHGKVTNDVQRVEVIDSSDMKVNKIVGFKEGDKEFNINSTLKPGVNRFLFRAYAKGNIYHYLVVVSNFSTSFSFGKEKWIASPTNDIWKAGNECYAKHQTDYQNCMDKMKQDYTYTKVQACKLTDGKHDRYLSVTWPGKNAEAQGFYKKGASLYYSVSASPSEHPSCEDGEEYELSLYKYDCTSSTATELIADDPSVQSISKCGRDIIFSNNKQVIYKYRGYEWIGATAIYDLATKKESYLYPFSEPVGTSNTTFTNGKQFLTNAENIEEKYLGAKGSLIFPLWSTPWSLVNCNDQLICTLRYIIHEDNTNSLIYDGKIDLQNKSITIE